MPDGFDHLLDVIEETFYHQNKLQWLSSGKEMKFRRNCLNFFNALHTKFNDHVSRQDENLDIHNSMINTLRAKFEMLHKLLKIETGELSIVTNKSS